MRCWFHDLSHTPSLEGFVKVTWPAVSDGALPFSCFALPESLRELVFLQSEVSAYMQNDSLSVVPPSTVAWFANRAPYIHTHTPKGDELCREAICREFNELSTFLRRGRKVDVYSWS